VTEKWLARIPYIVSTSSKRRPEPSPTTSLLTILSKVQHCNASNPRDKIYTLLPLQGFYDLQLPPSFTDIALNYKNAPNQHVFKCVLSVASFSNMGMTIFLKSRLRDLDCMNPINFETWASIVPTVIRPVRTPKIASSS